MSDNGGGSKGPRCVALVGPFQSGKTTLLEAILARTGAVGRQGSVDAGTSVGDASKEAREHKMSVELTTATTTFMGDTYVIRWPAQSEQSQPVTIIANTSNGALGDTYEP